MAVAKEGWLYVRTNEKWAKHYFVVLSAGPTTDSGLICQFEGPHARELDSSWKILSHCAVKKKRSDPAATLPDGGGQLFQFKMDLPSTSSQEKHERVVLASDTRSIRDVWIGVIASVIENCPSSSKDMDVKDVDLGADEVVEDTPAHGSRPSGSQSSTDEKEIKRPGGDKLSRTLSRSSTSSRRRTKDDAGRNMKKSPREDSKAPKNGRSRLERGKSRRSRRKKKPSSVSNADADQDISIEETVPRNLLGLVGPDEKEVTIVDSLEDSDPPHDSGKVRCMLCGMAIDIEHVDSHSKICSHDSVDKSDGPSNASGDTSRSNQARTSQIDASVQDHIYTGDVGLRLRSLKSFLSSADRPHPKAIKLMEVILRLAWLREYVSDWDARAEGKLTPEKAVLRKHYHDAINKMASELESFAVLYQPSSEAATNGDVE